MRAYGPPANPNGSISAKAGAIWPRSLSKPSRSPVRCIANVACSTCTLQWHGSCSVAIVALLHEQEHEFPGEVRAMRSRGSESDDRRAGFAAARCLRAGESVDIDDPLVIGTEDRKPRVQERHGHEFPYRMDTRNMEPGYGLRQDQSWVQALLRRAACTPVARPWGNKNYRHGFEVTLQPHILNHSLSWKATKRIFNSSQLAWRQIWMGLKRQPKLPEKA